MSGALKLNPEPVEVRPAARAVLPPLDEEALWADYRAGEAERLAHLPHVRQVLRTAEALMTPEDVPHPLGRYPELWAKATLTPDAEPLEDRPSRPWGRLLVILFCACIWAGVIWLGVEMYSAAREAMDVAAAEAIARRAM